ETTPNGRVITTHADLYGDELTVSTSGNRGTDFTVRFEPVLNGLRVTRRLDSDYLDTSIVVQSLYRRTSPNARWNVYPGPGYGAYDRGVGPGPGPRVVLVPDGAQLTARLDRDIFASSSHEGDRFTMTVL